jgi:hypothetical protein
VIDWQTISVGPRVIDVATFLVLSLAVEDRRAADSALVDDDVQRDYRPALVSLLAGVVGWLARPDLDDLHGRERALADAALGDGRLIAALRDHELTGTSGIETV